jgi:hypothetical protein
MLNQVLLVSLDREVVLLEDLLLQLLHRLLTLL